MGSGGTPSTQYPHWLWSGDGRHLYTEDGWWPAKPGSSKLVAVPIRSGMPVAGHDHLVFAQDGTTLVAPDIDYEYVVSDYPGARRDFSVQPIVPKQFAGDRTIRALQKVEHSALNWKRGLQAALEQLLLAESKLDPSLTGQSQMTEVRLKDAISSQENAMADVQVEIRERVRCLSQNSCGER